jgi:hypothetical protein
VSGTGAPEHSDTLKLGLLMETAQTQQTLVAAALERLREHTAGLDAVVRDEIRGTLLEEMQSLHAEGQRAAAALRSLQQAANLRLTAWSLAILTFAVATPFAVAWWMLPTPAAVSALTARREQLADNIALLTQRGGNLQLRRCGTTQRLCVRIDRGAPAYGESGDFLVVKGY